jgi:hypothetical protein
MSPIQITQDDIAFAFSPTPWDLGNQVLYDLCLNYPTHQRNDEIIAKVWLIGRAYAAAIERRKNADDASDSFYETVVAETIKKSKIDEWLSRLPSRISEPWQELSSIVTTHNKLLKLFSSMTGLDKRSLASKYLHFHRPDLFYIYDSRAKQAIMKVTPRINSINEIAAEDSDAEYLSFCRRCQWLKDSIQERFKRDLNPRQIDKILLRIIEVSRRNS